VGSSRAEREPQADRTNAKARSEAVLCIGDTYHGILAGASSATRTHSSQRLAHRQDLHRPAAHKAGCRKRFVPQALSSITGCPHSAQSTRAFSAIQEAIELSL
jgi:hypothetical protein